MYVLVIVVLLRSKGYSVVFEALCSKGMSINITSTAFMSYLLLCYCIKMAIYKFQNFYFQASIVTSAKDSKSLEFFYWVLIISEIGLFLHALLVN